MKSLISIALLGSIFLYSSYGYNGSTTAAVTLAGGIIKAQHSDVALKYKRKDCPVCKGKGWYMSGDNISKVDCGYCEPEMKSIIVDKPQPEKKPYIIHEPIIIGPPKCTTGNCPKRY